MYCVVCCRAEFESDLVALKRERAMADAELNRNTDPEQFPASKGTYSQLLTEPEGSVALVVLAEEFSRRMYRNTSTAFAFNQNAW